MIRFRTVAKYRVGPQSAEGTHLRVQVPLELHAQLTQLIHAHLRVAFTCSGQWRRHKSSPFALAALPRHSHVFPAKRCRKSPASSATLRQIVPAADVRRQQRAFEPPDNSMRHWHVHTKVIILTTLSGTAFLQFTRVLIVAHSRRVRAGGKQEVAVGRQLQPLAGAREAQVLHQLDAARVLRVPLGGSGLLLRQPRRQRLCAGDTVHLRSGAKAVNATSLFGTRALAPPPVLRPGSHLAAWGPETAALLPHMLLVPCSTQRQPGSGCCIQLSREKRCGCEAARS